jgi:anti-anti-sigma factor
MALTVDGSRTNLAVILQVNGRVDGETAPELDRVCQQWITAADRNLILDFSGVQYISSAGLSSVLGAGKEIDRHGGRLLICGLPARVKQVFTFSGLDTLFPLFETREAALSKCSEKS